MPAFGNSSLRRLATLHPMLQELCMRVVEHRDITILVGHRTEQEQSVSYNTGASTKQWPNSKHNIFPSMAVDVSPYPIPADWGDTKSASPHARDLEWKERVKFYEVAALFRFAWSQMLDDFPDLRQRFQLRFGADWDSDNDYRDQSFDDLPHIELIEVNNG